MAIISFKCPNCGGELIFDPATQKYKCEYCNSLFTQEELDAMKPMQGGEPDAVAQEQAGGEQADETESLIIKTRNRSSRQRRTLTSMQECTAVRTAVLKL